jgi:hypothetical protein
MQNLFKQLVCIYAYIKNGAGFSKIKNCIFMNVVVKNDCIGFLAEDLMV